MVNSKQKGGAYERTVCKRLSLWISEGERSDIFWRSSMSGGRATIGLAKGNKLASQSGDVSAIHTLGQNFIHKFNVECKHYKTVKYTDLIYKNKSGLPLWWDQCRNDASNHSKFPFLVAKANNYPEVLCLDRWGVDKFWFTQPLPQITYEKHCVAIFPYYKMYVFLFEEFLNTIDPDLIQW